MNGSGDGCLKTVCDYVHLNPIRASVLAADEPLSAYPSSSYPWYGAARARILQEELARLRWTESDLATRRKSDPAKLAIGARLRRETTLTIKQIAERLHLGTSHSAKATLHRWMKSNSPPPSSKNETTIGI